MPDQLTTLTPPPSANVYDEWHARYSVDAQADAPWHRLIKAHISPEDLAGKRVLEIGCGRGGFSCWLAQQPHAPREIVASDFSSTAVQMGEQYAQAQGLRGITWEVGDIQRIAYPDSIFDTVISCETIEHVPDPRRAVAELCRVLKPGGRLFLTTPNYLGMMGLYRAYLRLRGRPFTEEGQPINNFVLLPLTRSWVRHTGLHIVRTTSIGHYLPFPRRPPIEFPVFNHGGLFTRWFGLHSLTIAEKPQHAAS
ncbi:MAG TPA: class I SAM-dependent methyltransferase [Candidatus Angelobacter sp.]|jgi:2-polyprenyl-3-methyl-5-hydroxy-6-metoxy-1,4-benzoquinol methylase|nr:class I SAM-dependent methyltransferase [Candidatus Angelobacter sp.]